MNKAGSAGAPGGAGGVAGPTAAAAAQAAQRQRSLLQRTDADIGSLLDNLSHLLKAARHIHIQVQEGNRGHPLEAFNSTGCHQPETSGLMASYGVVGSSSYSYRMEGVTSNNSDGGDDCLLSTYSMLSPTPFRGMAAFNKRVMDCYNGFVAGSSIHHQYMAFTDVTCDKFNKIDAGREDGTSLLPKMIVLYDATEETLIVKIMPSCAHDTAAREFEYFLTTKFTELGVKRNIACVGSTQFGNVGERRKEADNAYRPKNRPAGAFPSVVVEVGLSESLEMLKNDAHFWLTKSNGQTKVVIVLHVDMVARKLLLQRWECVDIGRPRRANVEKMLCTTRVIQSLELVDGQQYVGAALVIPADKVFDAVPNNFPAGEFRFTRNELQAFSETFWSYL